MKLNKGIPNVSGEMVGVSSFKIRLNTVFYGQKPRFKEKVLCHTKIVIFYPTMSGTLPTAVTKKFTLVKDYDLPAAIFNSKIIIIN